MRYLLEYNYAFHHSPHFGEIKCIKAPFPIFGIAQKYHTLKYSKICSKFTFSCTFWKTHAFITGYSIFGWWIQFSIWSKPSHIWINDIVSVHHIIIVMENIRGNYLFTSISLTLWAFSMETTVVLYNLYPASFVTQLDGVLMDEVRQQEGVFQLENKVLTRFKTNQYTFHHFLPHRYLSYKYKVSLFDGNGVFENKDPVCQYNLIFLW